MPAKKKPAKKPAAIPPAWRWWLVEAVRTDAGRYRASGNLYPWWCLRLHGTVGRTPVESQWTRLDLPLNVTLRVLVRAPAWAHGIGVGYTTPHGGLPTVAVATDLGTTDPRPKAADLDNPLTGIDYITL